MEKEICEKIFNKLDKERKIAYNDLKIILGEKVIHENNENYIMLITQVINIMPMEFKEISFVFDNYLNAILENIENVKPETEIKQNIDKLIRNKKADL